MPKNVICLSLVALALVAGASLARAIAVALPPPGPQRMGNADALVIGRVIGIEPQDVEVEPFPGNKGKVKYRIAVVKVHEVIRGPKDAKMVRIAFYPPPDANPNNPNVQIFIRGLGRGNMNLEVGQDGLFILNKHHKENFYLPPNFGNFVSSQQAEAFKKDVESARKAAKILLDPMASLKSKDGEERLQAAAMLINKYRSPGPAIGYKFEPIAAEESKLILSALLEGRWNAQPRFDQLDSWNLFNQLGLDQDKASGWRFPQNMRNVSEFHTAAKAWLKDNVDKYRLQRMVPTDKPNQQVQPDGTIRILPVQPGRPIQVQPGVIRPIEAQPLPVQPERDK